MPIPKPLEGDALGKLLDEVQVAVETGVLNANSIPKFALGARAADALSEFAGTITARIEYKNGCWRYELSGTDDKGMPKGYVIDEEDLVLLEEEDAEGADQPVASRTGGPRDHDAVTDHDSLR